MLPEYTKEGIDAYIDHGVPPGDFLQAVFSNDLMEAVGRADCFNTIALPSICEYLYNYTPSCCWGSPAHYETWLQLWQEAPERAEALASVNREQRQNFYQKEIYERGNNRPGENESTGTVYRTEANGDSIA